MECLSGESLARVALHLDSRDRLSLALCSRKLYDCLDTSLGFQKTCNQIPSTLKLGPLREYGDDVHNGVVVLSAISEDGSTLSIVSIYGYPEGGTRWLVEIVKIPQGKKDILEFSTRGWLVEHMRCMNRLSNDGRILVIGAVVSQSREHIPEASLLFFLEVGDDSVKLVRGNLHMAWTKYFQCRITSSAEFVAVMGGSEDHYSINIFTADGSRLCWWPVRYSSGSNIAFTAEDELVYLGEMDDSDDESVEVRTEQEQPRLWIAIPPFGPNSGMTLLPPLPPNQGQRRADMKLDVSGRIISFGRHFGLLEVFDVRKVAAGWAYERRFHFRCPDVALIDLGCFQLSGDVRSSGNIILFSDSPRGERDSF
mmetsp:Transcript_11198/g.46778  ORF Transcript_11198/g.46778 Transcript_11198/m.46778 type:complete len:367 (-) Transcript_11198:977-2077(-)